MSLLNGYVASLFVYNADFPEQGHTIPMSDLAPQNAEARRASSKMVIDSWSLLSQNFCVVHKSRVDYLTSDNSN